MTLTAARSRTASAIRAAVAANVKVLEIDGVLGSAEIERQSVQLPSVQVSVMGRGEEGIAVVAYVVTRTRVPSDPDALQLLDTVEETMRTLLGRGRPLLEVRTQTLYDPRAMKAGSAALWGVSVPLPYLLGDAPEAADGGLLAALDNLLSQYLTWTWVSTELERDRLLLDGPLPFALITYGTDSPVEPAVGVYRYQEAGATYERDTLGRREVTAQVDLLGRTEEEVETELDRLLAQIPRNWTYEGLALPVRVRRVVGSHWRRKEGAHATVAEVTLQAAVPQGPPRVVESRRMQGRTPCGTGFQPPPAAPPTVSTNGDGSAAVVQSIGVDSGGRIVAVQWAAGGAGYAAGDRLVFAQDAILGRWTLRQSDVAAGELQDLAVLQAPIGWVEEGKLRPDVQPKETV